MKVPLKFPSLLMGCCLALSPVAAGAQDASAQPAAETSTAAIDPAVVARIDAMGKYLRSLDRFTAKADYVTDVVLDDDQKVQLLGTIEYRVLPPRGMQAKIHSDRVQRELWYDGRQLTVFAPRLGYYARIDAPPTLAELAQVAEGEYGIEMPLADLFLWGTEHAKRVPIESAVHVGPGKIGNDVVDQFALRQGNIDWQVWITRGDRPLPLRLVMTANDDPLRPAYTARLDWDTAPRLSADSFVFKPPPGSHQIKIEPAVAVVVEEETSP